MMNKSNRAKKAIAKLQKKYDIKDCEGREGTITYHTFLMFSYGFMSCITEDEFQHILDTKGEEYLRLELYDLFIASDMKIKIAIVVSIIILIGVLIAYFLVK